MSEGDPPSGEREAMAAFVLRLRSRGIRDLKVIHAIETLPRSRFVLPGHEAGAYDDIAFPIQCGQTITPPYVVALIAQELALEPTHRVLEVGTGSGYLTAVLARLTRRVLSLDRYRGLVTEAEQRLRGAGIANVTLMVADGRAGWPDMAPFDRIVMTPALPDVPRSLLQQLTPDGQALLVVGSAGNEQEMRLVTADGSARQIARVRHATARAGISHTL